MSEQQPRISELIKRLQEIQAEHGDIRTFTNGEYGVNQCLPLLKDYLTTGEAGGPGGLLEEEDQSYFQCADDEVVIWIGGH